MNNLNDAFQKIGNWWFDLHYTQIQKRGLLAMAAITIALSSFLVLRGESTEIIALPIAPIEIVAPEIMIDVAGAVNKPGVYSLPSSSRVIDAIKAAGNSAPGADLSDINLARVIKDGEQIYVNSTVVNSKGIRVSKTIRKGPININRATASELDSLDGIGPVIAKRIVEYRVVNGPFMAIEDLQKVSGIGVVKFAQLKVKVRV